MLRALRRIYRWATCRHTDDRIVIVNALTFPLREGNQKYDFRFCKYCGRILGWELHEDNRLYRNDDRFMKDVLDERAVRGVRPSGPTPPLPIQGEGP